MIALALSLLLTDIRLQGAWDCPDRESVWRVLRELGAPAMNDQTAELVQHGDSLELFLVGSSGNILAQRVVPRDDPHCDRLAKVVAVLLAAWANELSARPPELPGSDSPVGPSAAGAIPSGAAGAHIVGGVAQPAQQASPAPPASPPPPSAALAEAHAPPAARPAPASEHRPTSSEWRVATGALGSVTEDGAALGVLLFGAFEPNGSRWGGHVSAWWVSPSTFPLGRGDVQWERFAGSLGASYAFPLRPFSIQFQADAILALLHTQASNFATNRSPEVLDPGFSAGVVAFWRAGVLEPWLGVWGIVWPFPERAEVEGATLSRNIPQFQLMASVGLALPIP